MRLRAVNPALAAILAVCVMLLGLAAISPALHEHLCAYAHAPCEESGHAAESGAHAHAHAHDHDSTASDGVAGEDACAVTLFAAGCETPVAFTLCPPVALHAEGVASFTELLLARALRGPERVCGPPALV